MRKSGSQDRGSGRAGCIDSSDSFGSCRLAPSSSPSRTGGAGRPRRAVRSGCPGRTGQHSTGATGRTRQRTSGATVAGQDIDADRDHPGVRLGPALHHP